MIKPSVTRGQQRLRFLWLNVHKPILWMLWSQIKTKTKYGSRGVLEAGNNNCCSSEHGFGWASWCLLIKGSNAGKTCAREERMVGAPSRLFFSWIRFCFNCWAISYGGEISHPGSVTCAHYWKNNGCKAAAKQIVKHSTKYTSLDRWVLNF